MDSEMPVPLLQTDDASARSLPREVPRSSGTIRAMLSSMILNLQP
jgi:hypothetical protein